ncbi:MAG: dihydrolipoyl dehydrogenase [Flavobacteriia bacterium]|nr:dihydrolipoyl dehydrogenase [Flavobacteriia bacterium]OIP47350.1 MAG: dihydrolipoyl dehydrogenase [Flavobacteriaceae bacterium CG2_30_31_66]PIV95598.1 MAG: dihydrolipoyl dehydrogenase [Flavobacteriaceae bacterium CG17_big_fil_post_rev_8_21_14_2_50_31_13]PIY15977.1 MAG: dihydrolipoyl dehydrogenase [Flavobacteriaceae bacterium CG_4_10_14_3_um_filter_31_253]PIZ11542.1 MAG: dihydrolipoyl dehydrogenase [Flavobacteriaceae bacterium CG_4_10_14_0_8_um_filter_31_99]PJC09704.1 MAG: dihydrolipoyl dehy
MKYDIIVIGSGPGGYIAAVRASQLGKKVAIIEKYSTLGGTCLNVGCIPSKALLDSAHHYYDAVHHFAEHGITVEKPTFDFGKMVERKANVVETTTGGIKYLMEKNSVDVFEGLGSFEDATHVKITKKDGSSEMIEGTNIIIATGSKPSSLPFIKVDKERIITSTEALKLKEVPKHLIVIGGGVIGLELGSVYARLGAEVTVIEYAPKITPTMDGDISKELLRVLKKQGINFNVSHGVTSVERNGNEISVKANDKKGQEVVFTGDYCLVSVGRKPYTEGLGLEKVGVKVNEKGQVEINNHLQTNVSNIYAIGDVVKGAMLAHKAEEEGVVVAEFIAGEKPHIDYNLIPGIVYTWPEVAAVGKTEEELIAAKINYKAGKFSMRALGRSRASGDIDGFVKVLADKKTDEILGVHMVGARVADLIMEAAVAMEFRASAEDLARICHGHPTYAEAVKEAAKAAWDGKPLNA